MPGRAKEFGPTGRGAHMYRIGHALGAFHLLHIGHLNLFRYAKS
jgi:hypothetical protein